MELLKQKLDYTEYPKLQHKIVWDFATGKLPLNASTFDFLMYISRYVDFDGKINIEFEKVKIHLHMQLLQYKGVLRQLHDLNLITKRGQAYYSNFHINTNGKDGKGLVYLSWLSDYLSPALLEYSLNLKRLFYYFHTFTLPGQWQSITVENLYQNSLKDARFGIGYFESYKDMSQAILTLIQNGHIEIIINNMLINSETRNFDKLFHDYCGFDFEGSLRKERTSKHKLHKIKVRVRKDHGKLEWVASNYELQKISEQFGVPFEEIPAQMKNYIIGHKNTLIKVLGVELGISIYRKAIYRYFNDNFGLVLYHAEIEKTADYIKDNYILNEVKNIILGAAKRNHVNVLEKIENGYLVNNQDVINVINFYLHHANENHMVLLDVALERQKTAIFNLMRKDNAVSSTWEILKEEINEVYLNHKVTFGKLSTDEWKEAVRKWAKMNILLSKEAMREAVDSLRNDLFFYKSKRKRHKLLAKIDNEDLSQNLEKNKVPLYNFLEEN